ncbi:hypothetical protein QP575_10570 [Alcaligenes faecalis subsp. phenolicus]|uniref:hypothetical protein n=1 Tax=Alcaligenes nematophilus TaxID=2994643 RepID=UPI002AA2EBCB|nr:hypothetical protein [Alcaligenes phenolicus]
MKWKDWPCWVKVAIAVGFAVFVFNWPSSSGEWASWVQAIGAIGAIVGAFKIVNLQARSQYQMEAQHSLDERNRKQDTYEQVFNVLNQTVNKVCTSLEEEGSDSFERLWNESFEKELDLMINAAQAVPLHELETPWKISFAVAMIVSANTAKESIRVYLEVLTGADEQYDPNILIARRKAFLSNSKNVSDMWEGFNNRS